MPDIVQENIKAAERLWEIGQTHIDRIVNSKLRRIAGGDLFVPPLSRLPKLSLDACSVELLRIMDEFRTEFDMYAERPLQRETLWKVLDCVPWGVFPTFAEDLCSFADSLADDLQSRKPVDSQTTCKKWIEWRNKEIQFWHSLFCESAPAHFSSRPIAVNLEKQRAIIEGKVFRLPKSQCIILHALARLIHQADADELNPTRGSRGFMGC